MNTTYIEKEMVSFQQLSKYVVLSDAEAIALRGNKPNRAVLLGNLYKVKSKICFQTQEGSKVIETTIWAVTSNYNYNQRRAGNSYSVHYSCGINKDIHNYSTMPVH